MYRQMAARASRQKTPSERLASNALPVRSTNSFVNSGLGFDFSRIRVSAAPPGTLQGSLMIGRPGDPFEQEADNVADSMTRSSISEAHQSEAFSVSASSEAVRNAPDKTTEGEPAPVETAAEEPEGQEGRENTEQVASALLESEDLEKDGEKKEAEPASEPSMMQSRELPGRTPTMTSAQGVRLEALRGRGESLPAASRGFFESQFGQDFGRVRIHADADAGTLARSVGARAFTVGHDIVFGKGHYEPASPKGRWLLAHELTHVLQQGNGGRRSPDGIRVRRTGPRVQGGFFSKVWSGIKKGVAAVAQGTKWVAGKVWSGVKAAGRWSWNVLKSGAALAWNQIVKFPGRIWRLIKHLGTGIAGVAKWLWGGLKLAWHLDFKGLGKWLVDGFLSGAAWVGRLVAKLVDIAGIGEVWDLLSQIIKVNTRTLTSGEKSEARRTFKTSISYWQVRVDEYSLISAIGSAFQGGGGMGVTTFHTINFNQRITAAPGSRDMQWLTHELTHVSQYEHVGSQYLGEAIHAQATTGYGYGGPTVLWRPSSNSSPNPTGKHFNQFNREQQGDIAAHYYGSLYGFTEGSFTPLTSDYEPVIDELRKGDL
jgi:hypothetical protein